jgi:hypothetical protein
VNIRGSPSGSDAKVLRSVEALDSCTILMLTSFANGGRLGRVVGTGMVTGGAGIAGLVVAICGTDVGVDASESQAVTKTSTKDSQMISCRGFFLFIGLLSCTTVSHWCERLYPSEEGAAASFFASPQPHESGPGAGRGSALLFSATSRLSLWWVRIASSPVRCLFHKKRAQLRQIGEPVPLARTRILQRSPPDWVAVVADDLPQA